MGSGIQGVRMSEFLGPGDGWEECDLQDLKSCALLCTDCWVSRGQACVPQACFLISKMGTM